MCEYGFINGYWYGAVCRGSLKSEIVVGGHGLFEAYDIGQVGYEVYQSVQGV